MRCFAILALVSAAVFDSASALVDASRRTTVTQEASAYDMRSRTEGGCRRNGCSADLTRDMDTGDGSRWSCKEDLEDDQCTITYMFEEPQDIVHLDIQFYKGDERVRKLKVTGSGGFSQEIESSGTTDGSYERFDLHTDETAELTLEALGLGGDEWISLKEVRFMVE